MHPLSLLITVLLIALVTFLVVYLWRQYIAEQRQAREALKKEVRAYLNELKRQEDITKIKIE